MDIFCQYFGIECKFARRGRAEVKRMGRGHHALHIFEGSNGNVDPRDGIISRVVHTRIFISICFILVRCYSAIPSKLRHIGAGTRPYVAIYPCEF